MFKLDMKRSPFGISMHVKSVIKKKSPPFYLQSGVKVCLSGIFYYQ